jgi:hypothetical protein
MVIYTRRTGAKWISAIAMMCHFGPDRINVSTADFVRVHRVFIPIE